MKNPFAKLTKFELGLWIFSLVAVSICFIAMPQKNWLTLIGSLIGVTSLIFCAKGMIIGPILTVVFSIFYGIISYFFRYYGEMITYLLMTTPMAIASIISWLKNPYPQLDRVKVGRVTPSSITLVVILTAAVTVAFYFILRALDTTNLIISTISVTTSFLACSFVLLRSPYYALAYALNDVVLIIMWIAASVVTPSYVPMVACFAVFLINDVYGFINWQKMKKEQENIM